MTPDQFIDKWKDATLKERSGSQEHFLDLCRLLEEPSPAAADPTGSWYCFEKGAAKAGGGDGWADVWRRNCFGWEYKGKHKDLKKAFQQLQNYTPALEYPPLLIVSDMDRIEIHTAFTGTVPDVHVLLLEDLRDAGKRRLLKWAFTEPERLRPDQTTAALTEAAAGSFGGLAQALRARGHDPWAVGHFCIRVLFCLFAEHIELLPRQMFTRLLDAGLKDPASLTGMLQDLFGAMAKGGRVGFDPVDWFNGGLFDSTATLPLELDDIKTLRALAPLDWSAIEPSIFGTLFERGLDPDKRSQLGAHYTDRGSIMRLVDPVVLDPLRDEWTARKGEIEAVMAKAGAAKSASARTKAQNDAHGVLQGFLARLAHFRVLDPACGSGNFLLLSLLGLKDLEHQVILEAETLGLSRAFPMVGPECVLGIELNPYAAELARVTVWIGEIQWMLSHGFNLSKNPILKPLNTIEQRDAVVNPDGTEPEWPVADVIVGNPPFLGDKKMLGGLGEEYVTRLRSLYQGRVPGGADLVTYWFEKARAELEVGRARYAGLVATNSIRGGANRKVLGRICESGRIFNAWSDEPWVNEGAAVRVSLVCLIGALEPSLIETDERQGAMLNGQQVMIIHADLTAGHDEKESTIIRSKAIPENLGVAFLGTQKNGKFEIHGDVARAWLRLPNPHDRSNSDVLQPWANGINITKRPSDLWIVDFGTDLPLDNASLYEMPFAYLKENVENFRSSNRREAYRQRWWIHAESRPGMRAAIARLNRFIVTPTLAKYRVFKWLDCSFCPDKQLVVIARSDDTTFGILHSRFHELWSLRMGTSLEDRPRYTPTTTFETFPFPPGLNPADTAGPTEALDSGVILPPEAPDRRAAALGIAEAAYRLNALREAWLNPPGWVDRVPEVVDGYPDRIIPKPEHAADLKKRTLTNLYNARPTWLDHAHQALDAAVAAAYGWGDYGAGMAEEEILRRLLALNLERSQEQETHQ
ncbi:class I SAM-dependent DNA methyltransferase [Candidatus Thiodictyon syntrophicum]|uniref:site-specific DNA-methyltransferase (adenine-specific) n=1 Tax=Candidatus Thiodictyon syntrophicum TaxID=1166950 RepID=A0A2K8U412_9GAMM|nr:DNA methyltransferase [Candidatus Thiodictyon syntrophicum]AUB80318.1 SAM-dependent methyltransferase [Candidatus Thiodictyon syntrophicum]